MTLREYNAVVVGGGFFGINVALYLRKLGVEKVLLIERNEDLMQQASYNNQARIHGGYHYPRSLLTALRSQINFPRFMKDFEPAVVSDFSKYYAIAQRFSKVTAPQFWQFSRRIGAPISQAPPEVKRLFDKQMIEDVFAVQEFAYDSKILKKLLIERMVEQGIEYRTGVEAKHVQALPEGGIVITTNDGDLQANDVFNCTYAGINRINQTSGLPQVPLKHELTEMALMELPPELDKISVTVMCGPFFSFMPFPDKKLHTLSHVRYTPHTEWHEPDTKRHPYKYITNVKRVTNFPKMMADAKRYMPVLGRSQYRDSLWEIKTVLPRSEADDSRPILFRPNHGIKHYHCIMGGKIDNIYDTFKELKIIYAKAHQTPDSRSRRIVRLSGVAG